MALSDRNADSSHCHPICREALRAYFPSMVPPEVRGKKAFVESPVSVVLAAGTVSVAVPFSFVRVTLHLTPHRESWLAHLDN